MDAMAPQGAPQTPPPLPPSRKRRRWPLALGIGGLVVWVVALIAGVVALFASALPGVFTGIHRWDEETVLGSGTDKIAEIRIEGEITPGEGGGGLLGGTTLGSDDYVSMLQQAQDDEDVKAVLLRIDSPGGAVVASDDIYHAILRVKAAGKPVVVSMGDEAASGGYYIASAANRIFANPSTLTGSIGVIAIFINLQGTANKIGAQPVVIKSGLYKDIGSPYRAMTPAERGILQRLIDQTYGQFVQVVSQGRGISADQVRKIADGRVYSGQQAKDLGLVDEFGTVEDAFQWAKQQANVEGARLVVYRSPGIGLGSLLRGKVDVGEQVTQALTNVTGVPARPDMEYLWLP